jgi:hypothetical protein
VLLKKVLLKKAVKNQPLKTLQKDLKRAKNSA